jgi:hypothetical protein
MEVYGSMSNTKLCLIKLDENDKVRGNYEIITSGPVKHIMNHKYLVSEEQIANLNAKGIKYTIVKC